MGAQKLAFFVLTFVLLLGAGASTLQAGGTTRYFDPVSAGDGNWTVGGIDGDWRDAPADGGSAATPPGLTAVDSALFDQGGVQSVALTAALAQGSTLSVIVTNATAAVTINCTGDNTFNFVSVTAGASLTIAGTSSMTLTVTGSIVLGAGAVLNIGANCRLNNTTTGFAPGNGTVTIAATGVLELDVSADFTGVTVTNSGILRFDTQTGNINVTPPTAVVGATVECIGGGTVNLLTNTLACTNLGLAGGVTLSGSPAVTTTGNTTMSGAAVGAGSLTVGAQLSVTGGTNSVTPLLNVDGDFIINGGANFTNNGGTMTGDDMIFTGAGDVSLGGITTFDRAGTTSVTLDAADDIGGSISVSAGTTVTITNAVNLGGGTVAATGVLNCLGQLSLFAGPTITNNGTINLGGGFSETGGGSMAGAGLLQLTANQTFASDATAFTLGRTTVTNGVTATINGSFILTDDLTLLVSGSWVGGAGDDLTIGASAGDLTITVADGTLSGNIFTAGNTAGVDITVDVTGTGTFTMDDIVVPLAGTAGNVNTLTLNQASSGVISVTDTVAVASDDANSAGDGSELIITAGSTVTFTADVSIGTSGAGGATTEVNGARLTLGAGSTMNLSGVGAEAVFEVGRCSILAVNGNSGNEAAIAVTGATPYAMTLDGGVDVDFLDIGGYDSDGLQLLARFGEAAVTTFHFSDVNFTDGVIGGAHLTVGPDLVASRGGFAVGEARFEDVFFDNSVGVTGNVIVALTVDTSSLKLANTTDDYGIGFILTANAAEGAGVALNIGGDNDGADENENITWEFFVVSTNTLTVSTHPANLTGDVTLGTLRVLLVANFTLTGSGGTTVTGITVDLAGANIAANIENVTLGFDTDNDLVVDALFGVAQDPAGAGTLTFTGSQAFAATAVLRLFVGADIEAGAGVDTIRVRILDASTDVTASAVTAVTGSADGTVRTIVTGGGGGGGGDDDGGGCVAVVTGPCWAILGLLGLAALRRRRKQAQVER
ncbi:MAG: hypothetical protein IT462_01235 [Planctomycetes bacterium]|nr:hypothetical protein [Planctomycetota bacterium]